MGKFRIKETASGIKFDLVAKNGQIIATSEVYNTEASCLKGIESVKKNAPVAKLEDRTSDPVKVSTCPKFEIYVDKAGEFRFRLKARNGEIIATGEGYTSAVNCKNGIESVRKNAVDAETVRD